MLCNGDFSFVPLRSPLAVQSIIANMSKGLNIIEIGTREGNTVNCYRHYASSVLAIEINNDYCKSLYTIPNISVICPTNVFKVPKQLNKDAITFWTGEYEDEKIINFILSRKKLGIINKSVRLWTFVDHQLREEVLKY